MKDITEISSMVGRCLDISFDLPRKQITSQEIIEFVNRKNLIQKIHSVLFKNESFDLYIQKNNYGKKIDFLDVNITFSFSQKGFRFTANQYMICSVENESHIYKLIIPLHKENSELYLFGILSFMEPTRMLEWSEYGFVSKSKISTKETRIHNKFCYSLEEGKNGEKDITAQEYFYMCLLEDAAMYLLTEINNERLRNSLHIQQRELTLLRIWSVMNVDCFSQNKIDVDKPIKDIAIYPEWEEFESFYNWTIKNQLSNSICMNRIDLNADYSPSNCCWFTEITNPIKMKITSERYYWHYFNHFYYSASSIRETTIIINEVEFTLSEASEKYKIPGHIIIGRIYSGLKDEELIAPVIERPTTPLYNAITIEGETKSAKEWSESSDVPVNTIISRIRYGWTGKELLKKSRRKTVKSFLDEKK